MKTAALVPELYVSDLARSLDVYCGDLGFAMLYSRPEDRFAFLEREGAQIMLEQPTGRTWLAAPLDAPFGRGVNFQITVSGADALWRDCQRASANIFLPLEEKSYRRGSETLTVRQFIVQDPDGYLLQFGQRSD